jgi:hypothetical protein
MRRYYVVREGCGQRRMRFIEKTWKMIRCLQAPTDCYYQCLPNKTSWASGFDREERNRTLQ